MKKTLLEEDIQELKGTNKLLDSQIEYEKKELEREKEKVLEVKNQRISMGEITQTTKERLFRNMGYVKSFHRYKDYGKVEKRDEKDEKNT